MGISRVAVVPLRGGSKSIPLKNIKPIAGKPLCMWAIESAAQAKSIDQVFVCTDSKEIMDVVQSRQLPKVRIVGRSPETATDSASTESVLLEFAESHSVDEIVLIQATSPLLTSLDIERGIAKFTDGKFDTLLSVVRQKRFFWKEDGGAASPLNYRPEARPRRQEFDGVLVENGAFYIMRAKGLMQTGCRLHGKMGLYEMHDSSYFEVDEQDDWLVIEQLLKNRKSSMGMV